MTPELKNKLILAVGTFFFAYFIKGLGVSCTRGLFPTYFQQEIKPYSWLKNMLYAGWDLSSASVAFFLLATNSEHSNLHNWAKQFGGEEYMLCSNVLVLVYCVSFLIAASIRYCFLETIETNKEKIAHFRRHRIGWTAVSWLCGWLMLASMLTLARPSKENASTVQAETTPGDHTSKTDSRGKIKSPSQ